MRIDDEQTTTPTTEETKLHSTQSTVKQSQNSTNLQLATISSTTANSFEDETTFSSESENAITLSTNRQVKSPSLLEHSTTKHAHCMRFSKKEKKTRLQSLIHQTANSNKRVCVFVCYLFEIIN
jgi:hypothetical protein